MQDVVAPAERSKPTLHPEFAKNMVRTFDDSDEHGVHLLFNEWWPHSVIRRFQLHDILHVLTG